MVAFAILWTRLRSHSSRKGNVTCVVTVLRSHKEVPWIDPFHVPLSRLMINFAGDTQGRIKLFGALRQ